MDTYLLRILPLGGVTNVTMNMYIYELYKNNALEDILIVDCGIGFPKEKELGVDLVIPDISYLKDKKDKIRALLLTHGHEDHISALKFHWQDLGCPPVYGSKLTAAFVESQFAEKKIPLRVQVIEYKKKYFFGNFQASYIHVTHSIPDTTHILVKTPVGTIYHGSDYKFDLTPPYGESPDFHSITQAGQDGVLCMLTDCLGVERPGITLSESAIGQTFEDVMRQTKGMFVMTTFSSNISRIHQCIEAAIKFNRKIVFLGRSMKQNIALSKSIGYLPQAMSKFELRDTQVSKHPPSKICLIVTGSQGQIGSALSRIADKQHKFVKLGKGDKIIFSSDPIPGNEEEVFGMIEKLSEQGADVIYSSMQDDLHASGHASSEEMKLLLRFVKPKYVIPIGGTPRYQRRYREMAEGLGWDGSRILSLKNGENVFFDGKECYLGPVVETRTIYVDSYGTDDVNHVVLRDRRTISQEGIVFVTIPVSNTMKLLRAPEYHTRGFIHKGDQEKLNRKTTERISQIFTSTTQEEQELELLRKKVIRDLEKFYEKETERHPLIVVEMMVI